MYQAVEDYLELLCCPNCKGDLTVAGDSLKCSGCDHQFEKSGQIPLLFWPNEWTDSKVDVTDTVQAFYEETPFPNYDDFDSAAALAQKAKQGIFAKMLDDQVPQGTMVLECGCGTGQLSNFLAMSNRTVFGTDICLNSLRLAEKFRADNELRRVQFLQMNLFRPIFKPGTFDLVVSNGVLHHTSDPFLAFKSISTLVKPGGYLLVGLYHRYGRLITDTRRVLFRVFGERLMFLDPNLRSKTMAAAKRRAWFMDQYRHPHESKHTIAEVMGWLDEIGFEPIRSIPSPTAFKFSGKENLFRAELSGTRLERTLVEFAQVFSGSREGGFFIVTGRRPLEDNGRDSRK